MSFAKTLTDLRLAKKASLQVVADAVGSTKPHIHDMEKGKSCNPTLELLKSLAAYYDVTIDYLAFGGLTTKSLQNPDLMVHRFKMLNPTDQDFIESLINRFTHE